MPTVQDPEGCRNDVDFEYNEFEAGRDIFVTPSGNCLSIEDIIGLVNQHRAQIAQGRVLRDPYTNVNMSSADTAEIVRIYNANTAAPLAAPPAALPAAPPAAVVPPIVAPKPSWEEFQNIIGEIMETTVEYFDVTSSRDVETGLVTGYKIVKDMRPADRREWLFGNLQPAIPGRPSMTAKLEEGGDTTIYTFESHRRLNRPYTRVKGRVFVAPYTATTSVEHLTCLNFLDDAFYDDTFGVSPDEYNTFMSAALNTRWAESTPSEW